MTSHGLEKHQLNGIIGAIAVPFVPHPVTAGVVYVRVSNVHRQQKITVRLVRADDYHELLWAIEAEIINQNKPLDVHTLVAKVPPFLVTQAGRHVLEAMYNGVQIASVPIMIQAQFESPPPGWPGVGTQEGSPQ
ncbi:MAG: hypothetical protein K2W85_06770 [Phycisphaerales bacterium]|nr:hypothetical protein [Phycisphaerales bacterium]